MSCVAATTAATKKYRGCWRRSACKPVPMSYMAFVTTLPALPRVSLLAACFNIFQASVAADNANRAGTATCYESFKKTDFPKCQAISPLVALHWSIRGDQITVGIDAKVSNPWVAVGLTESGSMNGGDEWVTYRDNSGKWKVGDYHSLHPGEVILDAEQDVKLVSALQEGGHTLVVLRRKLNTCDPNDLKIITGAQQFVMWSTGANAWPSYHEETRGSTVVVFDGPPAKLAPSSAFPQDLRMLNVTIPSDGEPFSWFCTLYEVPRDKRYQIIGYEPLYDTSLVHHAAITSCAFEPTAFKVGEVFDCAQTIHQYPCMNAAPMMLGPTARLVLYPPNTGFAVGKGAVEYLLLQIHYTNLQLKAGVVDNSGIRLWMTDKLRPDEIGVFVTGEYFLNIPPGEKNYPQTSVCGPACTSQLSQYPPLKILASTLHMHMIGTSAITRHVRNGTELNPVNSMRSWDFQHQVSVFLPPSDPTSDLLPGDSLITTCSFDTSSRNYTTIYGPGHVDEMCFNFIFYYPRIYDKFEVCHSNVAPGLQFCFTTAQLFNFTADKFMDYMQNGWIVPSAMGNFTALNPNSTCPANIPLKPSRTPRVQMRRLFY